MPTRKPSLYPQKVRGRRMWVVEWHEQTKRRRQFFPARAQAEAQRDALHVQRAQAGEAWLALSAPERNDLMMLCRETTQRGVTLRQVWDEWRTGTIKAMPKVALRKAIDECCQAKAIAQRRVKYVHALNLDLDNFARSCGETKPVGAITLADLETWIAGVPSPWTRASRRSRLATLFSFCVRRGYLADNPCDRIERVSLTYKPPLLLTLDQAEALLNFVLLKSSRALAWFTLALLAGIRPEECDKLEWSVIRLDDGIVTIDAAASKVRQRRIVHLMPNALAWLKLAREISDLPLPHTTRRRVLRAVRDHLEFKTWPADILRHTCASMLLAHWQDAGRVAMELGNSPGVLFRHYREIVRREDAAKFWAINPPPVPPHTPRAEPS